jgi:hypothetical protein
MRGRKGDQRGTGSQKNLQKTEKLPQHNSIEKSH